MATILKLVLHGEISAHFVVSWLKDKNTIDGIPLKLCDYNHLQHEFIPYFLNYLRYQTIHLLQNSKTANPSPAKTPTQNCVRKDETRHRYESSNCIKLFPDSPSADSKCDTDYGNLIFSPNSSFNTSSNKKYQSYDKTSCSSSHRLTNNSKSDVSQKSGDFICDGKVRSQRSPVCAHLQDNQRTKQKLSFGEFLKTPDHKQKRKGLPCSSRAGSPHETYSSPTGQTKGRSASKKKNLSPLSKQGPPVFSLVSFSDFPPVGGGVDGPSIDTKSDIKPVTRMNTDLSEPVKKPTRRIKPTFLQPDSKKLASSSFLNALVEHRPNVSAPVTLEDGESSQANLTFREERELLRQMQANHKSVESCDLSISQDVKKTPTKISLSQMTTPTKTALAITPSKSKLDRSVSMAEFIVAKPDEVTNTEVLDTLVNLYSGCLHEHLFPNLIQELYFLTQLLTARGGDMVVDAELETEDTLYFLTVHNAVYFAINVLEKQINILKLLDKSTIKFLCDNQRVISFSPMLKDKLQTIYNTINSVKKLTSFPQSPIGGVSFQADTDNRKNFPNDKTFHQFKKQRDMFYELLREWELKHEVPGWSMVNTMANRIRSLVEFQTDLANHLHFARLFQSQLITMCKGDNSLKLDGDDEKLSLLSQLKKTNPEKFKKLQERFIQPFSTGGPCPPPRFHGYEEFFRDFIIAASSVTFIQHLSNTFASKVAELNDREFCQSTEKHEGSLIEEGEQEREMFESCLMTLRLVGKFLGFITFHPYCTNDPLPDVVQMNYLSLRNKNAPPLDVITCVKMAIRSKRLVVTIPWVVQFLSMMDYAAPLIDYYQLLLSLLVHILKKSWSEIQDGRNCHGHFLIVVLIGWLLENTRLLGGLFFQEPSLTMLSLFTEDVEKHNSVDCHHLVSQDFVYTCCPYAAEMRSLLIEFAVGTNSRTTIRKITPVAADSGPTVTVSQKQLQSQLEENFFHNHHASLKRTVEFVAERTASNFIKKFRSTVLPKSLNDAKKRVEPIFLRAVQSSPTNKTKDKLSQDLHGLAHTVSEEVKESIAGRQEFCLDKISEIMPLLLPEEQLEAVVSVATSISCRQAEERIMLWFNLNITKSMYLREVTAESDRLAKANLLNKPTTTTTDSPVFMNNTSRNTSRLTEEKSTSNAASKDSSVKKPLVNTRALSEILVDLKYIVRNLLLAPNEPIDLKKTDLLLTETYTALSCEKEILTQATKCLSQVLLDLALAVVCENGCQLDNAVVDHCLKLWKQPLSSVTELHHICSFRVFHSLTNSSNPDVSWKKFAQFVIILLEQDILTPSCFQKSCLQLLQKTEIYTDQVGQCLCLIVEHFNTSGSKSVDMCETLEWMFRIRDVNSQLSQQILSLITTNRNLTLQNSTQELSESHEGKGLGCDSACDSSPGLKWREFVVKNEHVIKTIDDIHCGTDIIVLAEKVT